uniref:Protein ECT2-like n=1 Tax=Sinocyclocheilus grahami TaxID=75366 RepID=A0A672S5Q2_SINGR
MADSSIVTLGPGHSLLVDSSVYDSRMAETSKEQFFMGLHVDESEGCQVDVNSSFLQAITIMEVPVVKIKEGQPGTEAHEKLIKSIVNMDINTPYIKTDNVRDFGDGENCEFETVFVLKDFQAPEYSFLYKNDNRILGPPAVMHCASKGEPLPFSSRPLYSMTMLNLSLCFTGFRKKDEVVTLVNLVHHMGGTIRKDFDSTKVTHLIAHSTHGEKYRVCIHRIHMYTSSLLATDFCNEEFRTEFKVPPFQDCVLSFLGFSEEERTNMEERTQKHGGRFQAVGDERCTHLVVEENSIKELPFTPSKRLYVVKQEWFWGSIQMDARAGETMYSYEKSPAMKMAVSLLSLTTPNSGRKRRRLRETLAQLTKETEISPFPPRKRPSAEHSLSMGSLLDISNTPDTCKFPKSSTPALPKQSARWQVSKELYQTESNYVDILATVLQVCVLCMCLACSHTHTHTHTFCDLSLFFKILSQSRELVKAYPPFVNFFEMSKETIVRCERQKPRFHAFLKINQAKPECGRQTLVELLIRPVQRLPSVALLLNDIKKHTSDDNPDKVTLEKAIESLKEVMTHINEDKRKTEGQKQIFDVVYEVDGCPANLLSSHRSLVHRVETIALGDKPCDRGEHVTLFLFNDCLEIARKRHKVITTFRSPLGQTRPPAQLKHIALMPLSQIRRVLDIQDTEECQNAFALVVHPPTEQENLLFSFQLTAEDTLKSAWLKTLCRQVANTICRADAEDLIQSTDPDSVQVSTKDMDSTLSRASRAIKKTSKKVTRAFSFTKTPKRVLQRAFLANGTPDDKSPGPDADHMGRMFSSSTLAVSLHSHHVLLCAENVCLCAPSRAVHS